MINDSIIITLLAKGGGCFQELCIGIGNTPCIIHSLMIERQKSAPITYSVFKHPDPKTQGTGAKNLETSATLFEGWGQKPFGDTLILRTN